MSDRQITAGLAVLKAETQRLPHLDRKSLRDQPRETPGKAKGRAGSEGPALRGLLGTPACGPGQAGDVSWLSTARWIKPGALKVCELVPQRGTMYHQCG